MENLILTGAALTGTGNTLDNVIEGNDLNNTLTGLGGADYLNCGAGADSMVGGGMHFSHDYGFGEVEALATLRLAA